MNSFLTNIAYWNVLLNKPMGRSHRREYRDFWMRLNGMLCGERYAFYMDQGQPWHESRNWESRQYEDPDFEYSEDYE